MSAERTSGIHRSLWLAVAGLAGLAAAGGVSATAATPAPGTTAQAPAGPTKFERDRGKMMLRIVRDDLEKYYYDPTWRGLDLEKLFAGAAAAIDEAQTTNDLILAVASPLFRLNDSHTNLFPPSRAAKITHGWEAQMIGDRCFVTAVQQGSDADAQGVRRGDEILEIDGDRPTRDSLDTILWIHRVLTPKTRTPLTLAHPGGAPEKRVIQAKVVPGQVYTDLSSTIASNSVLRGLEDEAYLMRHRLVNLGETLLIWKMPQFDLTADDVKTRVLRQIRKYPNLIIDLRGNGGGAVETLETLVGGLVGPQTRIADIKGRKRTPPMMARKAGDVYEGAIVVLVDSFSASASELLARTLQLAGRGKVLGDRSAGAVMESTMFPHMAGGERTGVHFATSITIADLVMTDGQSLERVGVTPDEVILPTAEDLANDRDPVLSRAAGMCGVSLPPEAAGQMFPMEWGR